MNESTPRSADTPFRSADDHSVRIATVWRDDPSIRGLGDEVSAAIDLLWEGMSDPSANEITRADFAAVLGGVADPSARVLLVVAWGAGLSYRHWPKTVASNYSQWVPGAEDLMLAAPTNPYVAFTRLWNPSNLSASVLPGLGTAFGTKVLYWADRARGPEVSSLIYDARVHQSLHGLCAQWIDEGGTQQFDHPWKCVRFANYAAYCELLGQVAAQADVRPDDVECTLFAASGAFHKAPQDSGCARSGRRNAGGGPVDESPDPMDVTEAQADLVATLGAFDWKVRFDSGSSTTH